MLQLVMDLSGEGSSAVAAGTATPTTPEYLKSLLETNCNSPTFTSPIVRTFPSAPFGFVFDFHHSA